MPVDIMDLFEFPEAIKRPYVGYDFEISFPGLRHGWLDVCIRNGDELIEYQAGYNSNDLKHTIKAVADLLPTSENYDAYFNCPRSRTRFFHELEPGSYTYDLKTFFKRNDSGIWLQILVMEDMMDYEGIWCCEDDFDEFCMNNGGLDAVKGKKILSTTITFGYFRNMFYKSCRDFILRKGFTNYMKEVKEGFPLKELTRIKP